MSADGHCSSAGRVEREASPGNEFSRQALEAFLDPLALDGLAALDMDNSDALMARFVRLSAELLRKTLPRLEALAMADDLDGVAFEAHKLKSAATSIGARPLELACEAVSDLMLGNQAPPLALARSRMAALVDEARQLLEELSRFFPAQPPAP